MLRLIWREAARAEASATFRYIAERNPAAADKLEAAIRACAEAARASLLVPAAPRTRNTGGGGSSELYRVYRVTAEAVEIVNVVHARQKYP